MQVIDRRGQKLTTTFGDLAIGEAFQDNDGDMCIKTDVARLSIGQVNIGVRVALIVATN